jgi:hypothetical protein
MTPLKQIKQLFSRKMIHQSSKQRCRFPKKSLKGTLMHHALIKTSLTKAAKVDTTPSQFSIKVVVHQASSAIMKKIFILSRRDQKRLKGRALTRISHLYLRIITSHHHLQKELRTKDKRDFSQLWSMGLLFITSFTIRPVVRAYPL